MSHHIIDHSNPPDQVSSHEEHPDILLDIEEPLITNNGPSMVDSPSNTKQQTNWPFLRQSSVSVRRVSPVVGFNPDEDLLSPIRSSSLSNRVRFSSGNLRQALEEHSENGTAVPVDEDHHQASTLSHHRASKSQQHTKHEELHQHHRTTNTRHAPSMPNQATGTLLNDVFVTRFTTTDASSHHTSSIRKHSNNHYGDNGAAHNSHRSSQATRAVSTGVINAIISIPVILSFSAIIFQDPFFSPFLGSLVKLVFLSSALHQLVFSITSSMPFAIGSVQDVGLIFLSAAASGVVDDCFDAGGYSNKDILGSALVVLSLLTGIVGIFIVLTGSLKLASMVQFVPVPVVGGYLAYVGYFMLISGISLSAGIPFKGIQSYAQLVTADALVKLLPAFAMSALLSIIQKKFSSPYALPVFLLCVPVIFYVVIFSFGFSIEDVRAAGWMASPQPEDSHWHFYTWWKLYNIHQFPPQNLHLRSLFSQAGKLLGLYVVVAFGSSMDIAAIQAEAPQDIDYNRELITVGLSNIVTGITGVGFSGSYIFSQTAFTMKMGVESRLMGLVVVLAQFIVFILPVNLMTLVPNFFFGSLVTWIGYDIIKDWIYVAAKRVSPVEYALLVATFIAVGSFGLEVGIVSGLIMSVIHFAVEYAHLGVKAFTVVPSRSGAVRSYHHRMILEAFAGRTVAVALSGAIFFGSANKLCEQVLQVTASCLENQPRDQIDSSAAQSAVDNTGENNAIGSTSTGGNIDGRTPAPSTTALRSELSLDQLLVPPTVASTGTSIHRRSKRLLTSLPSERTLFSTYDNMQTLKDSGGIDSLGAALKAAPLIVLLDMSRVYSLDATAARTFLTLNKKLNQRGIQLAITGLGKRDNGERMRKLLSSQGLLLYTPRHTAMDHMDGVTNNDTNIEFLQNSQSSCAWFNTMEDGLHWCEDIYLATAESYGLCDPLPDFVTLDEVLRANLEVPRLIVGTAGVDYEKAAEDLLAYCTIQHVNAGQVIFQRGESADAIYIVQCGKVLCYMDFLASSTHSRKIAQNVPDQFAVSRRQRLLTYSSGGVFGDLDFMLQRPRSFYACCAVDAALWMITREAFEEMAYAMPQVCMLLQTIVLRLNGLSATHAFEALDRSHLF